MVCRSQIPLASKGSSLRRCTIGNGVAYGFPKTGVRFRSQGDRLSEHAQYLLSGRPVFTFLQEGVACDSERSFGVVSGEGR